MRSLSDGCRLRAYRLHDTTNPAVRFAGERRPRCRNPPPRPSRRLRQRLCIWWSSSSATTSPPTHPSSPTPPTPTLSRRARRLRLNALSTSRHWQCTRRRWPWLRSTMRQEAPALAKKLNCSPQVYESLEHRLAVAEAAQRLRLPLLSQDGEVHEEIEKLSTLSRSSFDSTMTSTTPSSSSISTSYNNYSSTASAVTVGAAASAAYGSSSSEPAEPGVGGVADRFLGITSDYLNQVQQEQPAMSVDMADYQRTLTREIEARLEAKCDALADLFAMDERDSSSISQIPSARLPERVKLIIEEIEKEEALLLEDLSSMDRKFAEHYNVLEQILAVLIQFVKDKKLEHQYQYDDMKKTWLIKRCRTMNAKLSYLEHHLLRDTYTKETVPALHRIRKYLVEATKEASSSYNEAVSRLREYQGVDPHFDVIARQYHEIVKKLEGMQWTIHQVEMDLKPHHDHSAV